MLIFLIYYILSDRLWKEQWKSILNSNNLSLRHVISLEKSPIKMKKMKKKKMIQNRSQLISHKCPFYYVPYLIFIPSPTSLLNNVETHPPIYIHSPWTFLSRDEIVPGNPRACPVRRQQTGPPFLLLAIWLRGFIFMIRLTDVLRTIPEPSDVFGARRSFE